MALFNKLFSSRKTFSHKYQDNVREKLFNFNGEQVRMVLFCECDFRGRKLLFDSNSVEKIPLANNNGSKTNLSTSKNASSESINSAGDLKKFTEVSHGNGYIYTKPNGDIYQLGEMIFGSVAMSYRGTSFKIHHLSTPMRLMCTQVFPSPARRRTPFTNTRHSSSDVIQPSTGLEQSMRLVDSGNSFETSDSERSSVLSTASDTLLFCKRTKSHTVNVPLTGNFSDCDRLTGDSGLTNSYTSFSTNGETHSVPLQLNQNNFYLTAFSSGSLYKRWLRSASTSLEQSVNSLTGSASGDEYLVQKTTTNRSSKLGLAIIIELSAGQEEKLERFLMDHAAIIETMIWRARIGVETAYLRHRHFVSLMHDTSTATSRWLVDFLAGESIAQHVFLKIYSKPQKSIVNHNNSCDSLSINSTSSNGSCLLKKGTFSTASSSEGNLSLFRKDRGNMNSGSVTFAAGLSRFLDFSSGRQSSGITQVPTSKSLEGRDLVAERFLSDLCELLESIDVKHTNFFISTLVTAVLTHHLGWVTTALPSPSPSGGTSCLSSQVPPSSGAGNALWGQLTDLYGAIGHPAKMAHTIVTGQSSLPSSGLVAKILNSLTYFVRCGDVTRPTVRRAESDVIEENVEASRLCEVGGCIPMDDYKTYTDHLQELGMLNSESRCKEDEFGVAKLRNGDLTLEEKYSELGMKNGEFGMNNDEVWSKTNNLEPKMNGLTKIGDTSIGKQVGGLKKTLSCLTATLESNSDWEDSCEKVCGHSRNILSKTEDFKQSENNKTDLNLTSTSDWLKNDIFTSKHDNFSQTKLPKVSELPESSNNQNGVVFVLGESDELVGLKKTSKNDSVKRQCVDNTDFDTFPFKDSDFLPCNEEFRIKPSKSQQDLHKDQYYGGKFTGETKRSKLFEYSKDDVESKAKRTIVEGDNATSGGETVKQFQRAQSVPPLDNNKEIVKQTQSQSKYRYAGVKFTFRQHPQIVANYMRSKNIELSHLQFLDKAAAAQQINTSQVLSSASLATPHSSLFTAYDFTKYEASSFEESMLQTPSNASELEFSSDMPPSNGGNEKIYDRESDVRRKVATSNSDVQKRKLKIVELPMPKYVELAEDLQQQSSAYVNTLMHGVSDHYVSDLVLQGTSAPREEWESSLRSDLALTAKHPLLDQPIDEAVAIIANTDTWEVQLMSSHTYIVEKGSSGVTIGMSQLVANMLETLLDLWKLQTPTEYCLMHIEQNLQEFCLRSKALAELLLATEFCSMEVLTSTLQLEVNDIPLLMSIASTHSPLVLQKYGLSFQ